MNEKARPGHTQENIVKLTFFALLVTLEKKVRHFGADPDLRGEHNESRAVALRTLCGYFYVKYEVSVSYLSRKVLKQRKVLPSSYEVKAD